MISGTDYDALARERDELRDRAATWKREVERYVAQANEDRAERQRLCVQVRRLAEFADEIMEASFEGCDFDGGHAHDRALHLGLIEQVPGGYDPKRHGQDADASPGDEWYTLADWIQAALDPRDGEG